MTDFAEETVVDRRGDTPTVAYPLPRKAGEPPAGWARSRHAYPVARATLPGGDQASPAVPPPVWVRMPRHLPEEVGAADGTTVVCDMAAAGRDEHAFDGAAGMRPDDTTFDAGARSTPGQAPAPTGPQTVLGVPPRRLPTLALAVPAGDLRRPEGPIVGGAREVPVRWWP